MDERRGEPTTIRKNRNARHKAEKNIAHPVEISFWNKRPVITGLAQ
jgi:hypothetical protein